MSHPDWKNHIVNCECMTMYHAVRLSYWRGEDDGELIIDVPVVPHSLLKRMWVAIRYALGMARGLWFYEEVLVDLDGARGMRDFIDQFISEAERSKS